MNQINIPEESSPEEFVFYGIMLLFVVLFIFYKYRTDKDYRDTFFDR